MRSNEGGSAGDIHGAIGAGGGVIAEECSFRTDVADPKPYTLNPLGG